MIQMDFLNRFLMEVTEFINQASEQVEGWSETIKEKNRQFESTEKLPPIVQEQIETLRMPDLTAVVRAHMPKNATAVAAYYSKTKSAYQITLTFLKEREILPEEENKLIVISSELISREIENLFADRTVIILK